MFGTVIIIVLLGDLFAANFIKSSIKSFVGNIVRARLAYATLLYNTVECGLASSRSFCLFI